MTAILDSLPPAIVHALGMALLHFLWQGMAIAALLALALPLLRQRPAEERYAAACAALLAMAVAPLGTVTVLLRAPFAAGGGATAAALAGPASTPPWGSAVIWTPEVSHLVLAWMLVVGLLCLRLVAGGLRVHRLRLAATESLPDRWPARAEELARRMGVRAAFRVVERAAASVPATIGVFRPIILIPARVLTGLTAEQLEVVLAHELAHVRRWDFLVNLLQTVVETLLFYHPAVWWVSSRIRREREYCCDDLAVEVTGHRVAYARALAEMEALRGALVPHGVFATGGSLMDRVRRLVTPPPDDGRRSRNLGWLLPVTLFLALAGAASTAVRAAAAPQEGTPRDSDGEKTIVLHLDADGGLVIPEEHAVMKTRHAASAGEGKTEEVRVLVIADEEDAPRPVRIRRRVRWTSDEEVCEHCGAPLRGRAARVRDRARDEHARMLILELEGEDGEPIVQRIDLRGDTGALARVVEVPEARRVGKTAKTKAKKARELAERLAKESGRKTAAKHRAHAKARAPKVLVRSLDLREGASSGSPCDPNGKKSCEEFLDQGNEGGRECTIDLDLDGLNLHADALHLEEILEGIGDEDEGEHTIILKIRRGELDEAFAIEEDLEREDVPDVEEDESVGFRWVPRDEVRILPSAGLPGPSSLPRPAVTASRGRETYLWTVPTPAKAPACEAPCCTGAGGACAGPCGTASGCRETAAAATPGTRDRGGKGACSPDACSGGVCAGSCEGGATCAPAAGSASACHRGVTRVPPTQGGSRAPSRGETATHRIAVLQGDPI